jgi:hypothetical protein
MRHDIHRSQVAKNGRPRLHLGTQPGLLAQPGPEARQQPLAPRLRS